MLSTYGDQITDALNNHLNYFDYYHVFCNYKYDHIFSLPSSVISSLLLSAKKNLLVISDATTETGCRLTDARAAHSLSAYFFGAIISRTLCNGIFSKLKLKSNEGTTSSQYSFSYIWTITCLCHDLGYSFENDFNSSLKFSERLLNWWTTINESEDRISYRFGNDMRRFKKEHNIQNSIWKRPMRNKCTSEDPHTYEIMQKYIESSQHLYMCDSPPITFPIRSQAIINKYFSYRLLDLCSKPSCIDHGIAGGVWFFDRMIKNYVYNYKLTKESESGTNIDSFYYPNFGKYQRFFCVDQLNLFAYIADCIINHNIWCCDSTSSTAAIYEKFGLNSLITPKFKKVNFKENPLLFILAVADSLEPFKLFSSPSIDVVKYDQMNLNEIFQFTWLDVSSEFITIKPPADCRDKLLYKLDEMKKWIDIDYKVCDHTAQIFPTNIIK